jgi:ribonuclease HI
MNNQQSYYWHLNSTVESFDIELFAILKSLQQAKAHIHKLNSNSNSIQHVWIFSDNQAAIQRICKNSSSSGQEISYKLQSEAESLQSQNIQLHIYWVPGHVGIYGNEQADKAAKIAAAADSTSASSNIIDCSSEIGCSLTYLKRAVKNSLLQSWYNYYNAATKGAYYQNLDIQPAWKPPNLTAKTSRIVWSSYIQLKIGHGHFKSYLKRLPDYANNQDFDNKCDCNHTNIQSPAHLLLDCSKYHAAREKIREKLQVHSLSLKILLTRRDGIEAVFDFLKETKIARRNWLSD